MNEPKQLRIIQMNDIHGYYAHHPEMFIEDEKEVYWRLIPDCADIKGCTT